LVHNLPERQVIRIWQHLLLNRTELVTEADERLKIIYPGRVNDDQGADFRDAVIATSQGLIKGDIEVHVNSSDWQAHRHHRDPVYNRVVLHVVMWRDTKAATILENGKDIPVLALHKYIKAPISQWPEWMVERDFVRKAPQDFFGDVLSRPCLNAAERLNTGVLAQLLDCAGEERFSAKAARFQANLTQMEASQTLYLGIMGALGYSRNKLPFTELARRLPLRILESAVQSGVSDGECLARQQAFLLGTAGLLPSQRRDRHQKNKSGEWVDELERLWTSSRHPGVMSPNDWHLFKVRPNNSPVRRIVAMSYLVLRYRGRGMLAEVVDMVKEASTSKEYHRLESKLVITTDGYWASHLDFGLSRRIKSPTLLGMGQAANIIVNVILPFTFAWGKLTSRPELGQKSLELYRHYPKLVANAVERHMKAQLGLSSSLVNSARRQQGLIHIYNTLCTQGRCNSCPLGGSHLAQLEAGNYVKV
jgi:hypothetical protein